MRGMRKLPWPVRASVAAGLLAFTSAASGQGVADCGELRNNYGPYDYTNAQHFTEKLPRVEEHHYNIGVQNLTGTGITVATEARMGSDIGYTLRAFPNHHRALYTMMRYYAELVPIGAARMRYDPLCWFDRAKRFAPHDATVVMLEGIYYRKINKLEEAKKAYESALAMAPESAEINYNAGLLYVDLKQYDRAVEVAEKAYELGHPLPGLRNRLKRLGHWPENG